MVQENYLQQNDPHCSRAPDLIHSKWGLGIPRGLRFLFTVVEDLEVTSLHYQSY